MELLQIVPMLPPAISGVGDYALLLARDLQARHGVQTRFPERRSDLAWPRGKRGTLPGTAVQERSAAALRRALEENALCSSVLLHYVGHGYEPRGCPFWLVRALEQWKRTSRAHLIVLFHEVSGSGPIWTSGFWTAGLQTSLARRLARLGDSLRITTEVAARRVRAMLPVGSTTPVRVLPVFSTLGEPRTQRPYHERTRQMIVFGGVGWRKDAYTRHRSTLEEACRQMRIEQIVDIGVAVGERPKLSVPLVEAGVLSAADASELMSGAAAGFFTYPVLHIGKSTIFAAYCAHRLVPVTFAENALSGDEGLHPEKHFLVEMSAASDDDNTLAKVASSAHAWYRQHDLAVHARELSSAIVETLEKRVEHRSTAAVTHS